MKKRTIWYSLLALGIVPYVFPFLTSLTRDSYLSLMDWLVLHSFIYWPTYLVGFVLILISVYKLLDNKENTNHEDHSKSE